MLISKEEIQEISEIRCLKAINTRKGMALFGTIAIEAAVKVEDTAVIAWLDQYAYDAIADNFSVSVILQKAARDLEAELSKERGPTT